MENDEGLFISSIDLLNKTGLSRATLNNYIKAGILPRPFVKRPSDTEHSKAKRIGYFPVSVLGLLDIIRQYKSNGLSMAEITRLLKQKTSNASGRSQGKFSHDQISQKEICPSLDDDGIASAPSDTSARQYREGSSEKESSVRDPVLKHTLPPSAFSVLAADLQDAMKMCAELPPEEYCRLINQIWICTDETFKKYFGAYGRQSGNETVYFFLSEDHSNYLMNAIRSALELKEKMKKLSEEWKKRIGGWYPDLYLNIGIDEGFEYFERISAVPPLDFVILGDTAYHAVQLSNFSRFGSIWATKNLLNRLNVQDRVKVRYGIRKAQSGRDTFIESVFSRIGDLLSNDRATDSRFKDISAMTVTEIHNLH